MVWFFFFSSRRRHTRCGRDWSSDVCSSDLGGGDRQLRSIARKRPGAVVGVGAGELGRDIDVGELVLDRLERSDRPPEGIALGRVGSRHIEAGLRAAYLLERDEDGSAVEQ